MNIPRISPLIWRIKGVKSSYHTGILFLSIAILASSGHCIIDDRERPYHTMIYVLNQPQSPNRSPVLCS